MCGVGTEFQFYQMKSCGDSGGGGRIVMQVYSVSGHALENGDYDKFCIMHIVPQFKNGQSDGEVFLGCRII